MEISAGAAAVTGDTSYDDAMDEVDIRKLAVREEARLDALTAKFHRSPEGIQMSLDRLYLEQTCLSLAKGVRGAIEDALEMVGGDDGHISVAVFVADGLLIDGDGGLRQLGARVVLKIGRRETEFHGHPIEIALQCARIACVVGRTLRHEPRSDPRPLLVPESHCEDAPFRLVPMGKRESRCLQQVSRL